MMPAAMVTPVVVMAPVAVAADAARTVIGHDEGRAAARLRHRFNV